MQLHVTVITPTTHDRAEYNARIAEIFASQDYEYKTHLFDYDAGNIGDKRNRLCLRVNSGVILHMDSDDWYAADWISRSVAELLHSGKQVTGLSTFRFKEPNGDVWQYCYPKRENLAGATLCYYKTWWEQNKFRSMQVGEDNEFIRASPFFAHNYVDGFLASIHDGNTSPKNIGTDRWERVNPM